MRDLISIGRFAQITQLTIKALHIYDAIGLLRPVAVDAASGYRYYSITQLTIARRIRLLRSIDMALEQVLTRINVDPSANERVGSRRVADHKDLAAFPQSPGSIRGGLLAGHTSVASRREGE